MNKFLWEADDVEWGPQPLVADYSPDQPRVPAGSPEGGEWGGGGDQRVTEATEHTLGQVAVRPSASEKAALLEWQGLQGDEQSGSAQHINKKIRMVGGTGLLSPAEVATVHALDGLMQRAPALPSPIVVWRGQEARVAWQVGSTFTDAGIVSTTTSRAIAEDFARDTLHTPLLVRIEVPAGMHGLWAAPLVADDHEREFLLPRGLRYRVVGYSTYRTLRVMHVQVVPHG